MRNAYKFPSVFKYVQFILNVVKWSYKGQFCDRRCSQKNFLSLDIAAITRLKLLDRQTRAYSLDGVDTASLQCHI